MTHYQKRPSQHVFMQAHLLRPASKVLLRVTTVFQEISINFYAEGDIPM